MSLALNDAALETCQQEVNEDIMMYFALKDICIDVDDFPNLTLQDVSDKLTRKKFRDSAQG
jgi:hypothetical protein